MPPKLQITGLITLFAECVRLMNISVATAQYIKMDDEGLEPPEEMFSSESDDTAKDAKSMGECHGSSLLYALQSI